VPNETNLQVSPQVITQSLLNFESPCHGLENLSGWSPLTPHDCCWTPTLATQYVPYSVKIRLNGATGPNSYSEETQAWLRIMNDERLTNTVRRLNATDDTADWCQLDLQVLQDGAGHEDGKIYKRAA
jgi:hypothetical protein